MKLGIQVLVINIYLISSTVFCAESSLGGLAILTQPIGARQIAMGETFVATADDLNTLYYNPAGLTNSNQKLSVSYLQGLVDTYYASINLSKNLNKHNTLAFGVNVFQAGTIEIPESDTKFTTIRVQDDYLFVVGFANNSLHHDLSIGSNLKILNSTLIEKYVATAYMFDIGILYKADLVKGLSIGSSFQNIGTELKYVFVGDPLPLTFRFGLAYKLPGSFSKLRIGMDYIKLLNTPNSINIGVEYLPLNNISFRVGFRNTESVNYFSFGLGANFDTGCFEYSRTLMNEMEPLNQTTIALVSGKASLFGGDTEDEFKNEISVDFSTTSHKNILDFSKEISNNIELYDEVSDDLKFVYLSLEKGYYLEANNMLSEIPKTEISKLLTEKLKIVVKITEEIIGNDSLSVIARKGLISFFRPIEKPQDALIKLHYAYENAEKTIIYKKLYIMLHNYYPEYSKSEEIPEGFNLIDFKLYKSLVCIYNGYYDSAIKEAKEVLDLEPDNILALKRYGSALYCIGQSEKRPEAVEKARDIWRKVVVLSPDDKEIKEFLEKK